VADASSEARDLFAQAQARQAAHDTAGSVALAKRALALDPDFVEAIEHLATAYITRQARYAEGLSLIERTLELRPTDAGLWYSAGWCYEFVAHEIARRHPPGIDIDPRACYQQAASAFRHCLSMNPEGKLADDAADLLDHVENELR
jgi:tetratricopeptide (TPR) repeat protein